MVWECYLTVFKAESPVHIGYRQIGILKTTRYYITGRAMWGAITANLTRVIYSKPTSREYQIVGDFVKENIRTTYFYPAINKNDVKDLVWSRHEVNSYLVFMPRYTEDGIKFGEKYREEFEQVFIHSFVSTSIDKRKKSAEEDSLHEFEYIKNKIKIDNKIYDVYYIGYLFVRENVENNGIKIEKCEDTGFMVKNRNKGVDIRNVINTLWAGGERNYGFGKLTLNKIEKRNRIFGNLEFKIDVDDPIIKNLQVSISHLKLDRSFLMEFGEIEPLVGREWSDKGSGQKSSNAKICTVTGSVIRKGDFRIGYYGILDTCGKTEN